MKTRTGKGKKPKAKPDDPAQSKRFIEAARSLGAEDGGEAFQKAVNAVLKPKNPRRSS